jgi:transcriptional regulator with XRE-family HTH domain
MTEETPGSRLETYMHSLAGTTTRTALANASGVSRQQLIQWFDGKGEMRFSALAEAAQRLGVRRVDLVAVYDGVIAPETEEAAPQIEERLDALMTRDEVQALVARVKKDVTGEIRRNRETIVGTLARELGKRMTEELQAHLPQLRGELTPEAGDRAE